MGFILLFFSLLSARHLVFCPVREEAFQRLNHRAPPVILHTPQGSRAQNGMAYCGGGEGDRSSVIVANHLSFLDPILSYRSSKKQKTIVRTTISGFPSSAGFCEPPAISHRSRRASLRRTWSIRIKRMREYLDTGGNLFIFPEGHRSRDGRIGPFDQGAFKIARLCRAASIKVVLIRKPTGSFPPAGFCSIPAMKTSSRSNWRQPGADYESESLSLSGFS